MRVNVNDPRARRTRAYLRSAFLELAAERSLAAITISEVARRAEINRATIYLHYPDLDALAADAMGDAVATVTRLAGLCPLDAPPESAPAPLVDLFTHIAEHAPLYARALGAEGNASLAVRLREELAAALLARFTVGARPAVSAGVPPELHAAYLAGALLGVVAQWIGADLPGSAADAANATWRLMAATRPATAPIEPTAPAPAPEPDGADRAVRG